MMKTPTIRYMTTFIGIGLCLISGSCNGRNAELAGSRGPSLTASEVRKTRRAFDGAPPVIPHKPFGAVCTTCHTATGMSVPDLAVAPANPHGGFGGMQHCRQCHVFQQENEVFAQSNFEPMAVSNKKGDRLFPGAPPTIPHSLTMRENCLACHSGPSARPEIRCTHSERTNCMQCHVESHDQTIPPAFAGMNQ